MAFSPIQGSNQIENQYKRYLTTMFSISDADYQKQFLEQVNCPSSFSAGPYLDAHDNFATGKTTRQLVMDGVLPRYFLRFGFHQDRPLYSHQEHALRKGLEGKNIVVSTGTGSGKTESFLMPILAELASEVECGTIGSGVRAMLIYPMNALANDQVERLRSLLQATPEITFGCYTGQTKERTYEALNEYLRLNKKKPAANELISREQMKENHPNILITNYAMLEYLMVRPKDSVLFEDDTWKFVVLDEAHVYRGSTGIEVSMLLRRLRSTLRGTKLQYFITSATLGDENENSEVAEFASDLCDVKFHSQDVIRAKRVPVQRTDKQKSLSNDFYYDIANVIREEITPEELNDFVKNQYGNLLNDECNDLFELVRHDPLYWRFRTALQSPQTVLNISNSLGIDEAILDDIVTVSSFCEKNGVRLLDARYHTFLKATESVFITLNPWKRLFLKRRKEYIDEHDGISYKVFEINTCSSCHSMYIIGKLDPSNNCIEQCSQNDQKSFFYIGNSVSSTDEDSENDETRNTISGMVCSCCGHFRKLNVRAEKSCEHGTTYEVPVVLLKPNNGGVIKKCVACEAVNNRGILRAFFTGQEAVTSVIATSLFNALPSQVSETIHGFTQEDEFGFGFGEDETQTKVTENVARQFLCFSDSRQASAFFATYLDTSYRQLLYKRILVKQSENITNYESLNDFCEDLSQTLEFYGILQGTGYRLEKESWKAVLAEAADLMDDSSLSGLGILRIGMKPDLFPENSKLGLSKQEVNDLFSVLLDSMIADLAIRIPVSMTEEDREFYSYGQPECRYAACNSDTKSNLRSFIPKTSNRTNKRIEYLKHVMIAKKHNMDDSTARKLLNNLFDLLVSKGIVTSYKDGYQIDPSFVGINRPQHWYRCSKCKKITPYNISGVCMTYLCNGYLEEINPEIELSDNHYYRLYHDMDIQALRVKEHTAQLNRDKAYEYQQDFKDKKIDVLSCSTTFEMGVDVGSLETVFMRNMPPLPSNYAQRAGRAGRSKNSAAFALTFCNRSNHDFAFFERPVDMISGKIHAPHFNVLNSKIAIRHLYASALAFFWKKNPDLFSTADKMAESKNGNKNGYSLFRSYLESKPKDLKEYIRVFLPKELYDAFDCEDYGWIRGLISDGENIGTLTRAINEYNYEVGLLEEARADAFKNNRSTGYIEQRLRTYRTEDILGFLSRRNVMPQYGFPVDTVGLSINGKNGESTFGIELQRDLQLAISEYAPGSQVVANGQLFTGRYIKKVPQIGWKMYDYIVCEECKTLNIEPHTDETENHHLDKCRLCGNGLNTADQRTFIIPSFGFEADPNDIKKPGLTRPEKTYRTDVSYVGYRNDIEMNRVPLTGTSNALIMFSEKDEMAVLNKSDFHVCKYCGYAIPGQGFLKYVTKEHKMPSGRTCNNKSLDRYSLGYRFETDVFQLFFPDQMILPSDENEAYSVLYALQCGIVRTLDLEENDIAGCLQTKRIGLQQCYSFVFYDTTPGGAGHMRRLQNTKLLKKSIEEALATVENCTCGGENGHASCYGCLRNYGNQRLHDVLDRSLAISYLRRVLNMGYNNFGY